MKRAIVAMMINEALENKSSTKGLRKSKDTYIEDCCNTDIVVSYRKATPGEQQSKLPVIVEWCVTIDDFNNTQYVGYTANLRMARRLAVVILESVESVDYKHPLCESWNIPPVKPEVHNGLMFC